MKFGTKSKLFSILFVSVLIISCISLTLVQGDRREDPGVPPSGLLADLIVRVDNIQNELVNVQNELSSIHSDIGSLGDEVEWQVADIRDLIAFIDTDIRSDITLINEAINNVNDGLQNQIDSINEDLVNLQNQIDQLRSEDLMEIWDNLDNGISMLSQGIEGIWDDIDTNVHPRIDSLQDQINDIQSGIANLQSEVDDLWNHINNVNDGLQTQIDNLNTRTPQTGFISISAAAFTSVTNPPAGPYYNNGAVMYNMHIGGQHFVASVCLPDGVEIKGLTMKAAHGNELEGVSCDLVRSFSADMSAGGSYLVRMSSNSSISGFGKFYGSWVAPEIVLYVDNSIYSYFFSLNLPANQDAAFCFVTVEYEYPA